jgi:AcrR family transcriptional regulator
LLDRETQLRASAAPSLDRPLPRGRHGIPPDEIALHQRTRLIAAATGGLAQRGYASLSVAEISSRAGVSRLTFYKLYDNKLNCALEAQKRAIASLEAALEGADGTAAAWHEQVASLVGALLSFLAGCPEEAALALPCGPLFSQAELARNSLALQRRLTARLLRGAPRSAPAPDSLGAEVLVGGLLCVLADELSRGRAADIPALAPELTALIVAHGNSQNER